MSLLDKTVYLLDPNLEISRLDTPRFAPLRAMIIDIATTRGVVKWSACRGVHLDAAGPGEPRLDVWVKKTVEAACKDWEDAGLRFRLDESSSPGFGLHALRSKLGMTSIGVVGLDRVTIRAESDAASEQAGVNVGPFYIATHNQDEFDVELLLYLSDEGTVWSFAPGGPAAPSQPQETLDTNPVVEMDSSDDDNEDEEEGEEDKTWLTPLHNHQLKIAATLYALAGGQANVGISKADLVRPLEEMDVAPSALEKARVNRYDCGYIAHNQQRGADARLHLTGNGLKVLKRIYTSTEGDLETEALDTMVQNVLSGRRAWKKRCARREVDVEVEEAEAIDKVEAEEAPAVATSPTLAPAPVAAPASVPYDSLVACAAQLTTLLERFETNDDETANNDRLAERFSYAIGEFFRSNKRSPTTDESNCLLKEARSALAEQVVLGSGRVKLQEVQIVGQQFAAATAALVARMAE